MARFPRGEQDARLCSDGVFREFETQHQLYHAASQGDVHQAVTRLVDHANRMGGRDNITAVIVDVTASQKERAFSMSKLKGDDRAAPQTAERRKYGLVAFPDITSSYQTNSPNS